MSVDTRSARAKVKLPPEQPAIPQGKSGSAGYWLYLVPGLLLLLVIIVIPLVWNIVPHVHEVARRGGSGIHRSRELAEAPH